MSKSWNKLKESKFMPYELGKKAWIWYRSDQYSTEQHIEQFYEMYDSLKGDMVYFLWDGNKRTLPKNMGSIENVIAEMENGYEWLVKINFTAMISINKNNPYSINILHDEDADIPYKIIGSLPDRTCMAEFMEDYDFLTEKILGHNLDVPEGGLSYSELKKILD